jgi:hypothetical protein
MHESNLGRMKQAIAVMWVAMLNRPVQLAAGSACENVCCLVTLMLLSGSVNNAVGWKVGHGLKRF